MLMSIKEWWLALMFLLNVHLIFFWMDNNQKEVTLQK